MEDPSEGKGSHWEWVMPGVEGLVIFAIPFLKCDFRDKNITGSQQGSWDMIPFFAVTLLKCEEIKLTYVKYLTVLIAVFNRS